MVYTLFCAREEFDDDIIISYSDIVYGQDVLDKLIGSEADISVVVDKKWRKLWEKRMNNPLSDAETLKIGDSGQIVEIGKKAESYNEIEGQYIGLIKISKKVLKKISVFYDNLDKNNLYDGKNFENIYMTTFIQLLIDNGFRVTPVEIDGGWVEIDSVEDLKKLKDYTI
jgi:L-glutamine-phosphate cytidylyltransferase